jgi:tRNA-specific adenosine deaminase 1
MTPMQRFSPAGGPFVGSCIICQNLNILLGFLRLVMPSSACVLMPDSIYTSLPYHVSLSSLPPSPSDLTYLKGGDASTRLLALAQDPEMAALKDSHIPPPHEPNSAARGRNNYSLFGVLRTKPGRADSPPTRSMSCSDKIALWDILGIQGALGSEFFVPLYISNVVVGGIPLAMQEDVKADCERAFWGRLNSLEDGTYHEIHRSTLSPQDLSEELFAPFSLHRPEVHFTVIPFNHSREMLIQSDPACTTSNEC